MANTMKEPRLLAFVGILVLSLIGHANASFPYYGTKIGPLKRLHHGVSGDVYAVDSRTLFIKNFNYDGEAPAAYFYVGSSGKPSNEGGHRLRDERGGTAALTKRYRNKDITLSLPDGKTIRDIKWFSVWCDEFAVNFGDVSIPNNLDYPRPQKIAGIKGVHGVSADPIVIVDAQTLLVPNFSYDGEAPDAKFWVGRGQRPTAQGLRIPDENGKETALRRYDHKTIVLTLPGDLTIFDIGHFGVWCEAFTVDFGHVRIPEGLNVPPSLKMLGISPQSKLNCEVLYDDLAFEVRWAVAGESIVVQLVAKLANNEYMSFGISPNKDRSEMIGADVVVAWVDKESGKGYAQDYFLEDKSQCSGKRGTCPDINIEDNTNSVRLLNAAMVNGYSIVTYQRALQATDKLDLPISVNGSEAIVWAIGPLNERKEASFHSHFARKTHTIDFGRQPTWNCPMPEGAKGQSDIDNDGDDDSNRRVVNEEPERDTLSEGYPPARHPADVPAGLEPEEEFYDNRAQALQRPNRRPERIQSQQVPTPQPASTGDPWDIPAIQCYEPEDGVFYAQMGPTGGKHGYPAITGHVGWGISWYINGLLIPEIHVVRGKTYTFVVEGGSNPDIPAKYHPFYITDDPVGGYEHKREEEKKAVRIFAGVHRSRNGQITPTGVGRLCNWTPDMDGPPADDYQSFGAYQRTLTLNCDPGEPGVITWKPDRNTPDTVYYQCFTHRYLGWKIHVHDSCDDARFAASEQHEVRVAAGDIAADSSIRHETKVSPNDNYLLKHQTDLLKNHNMNGTPPKLIFELTKSTEITKLISDGIRAAEALEESILKGTHSTSANANANANTHPNPSPNQNQRPHPHLNPQLTPTMIKKLNSNRYSSTSSNNNNNNNNSNNNNKKANPPSSGLLSSPTALYKPPMHIPPVIGHQHSAASTKVVDKLKSDTHIHLYSPPSLPSGHTHAHAVHGKRPHANHSSQLLHDSQAPSHASHISHTSPKGNLTALSQKTIGLSEFLRPPQSAPLFHPVKLPGRRPLPGPGPGPIRKVSPGKQVLPQQLPGRQQTATGPIPQPSLIVNHYRKPPSSALFKPFMREKPFPMQAASVLLLGQPTELSAATSSNALRQTELLHYPKPLLKPVSVPYGDLAPQDPIQNNALSHNGHSKKEKKPLSTSQKAPTIVQHIQERPKSSGTPLATSTPSVFKKPFDVHPVHDEPNSPELATMKPAVNDGFKPDSVVVESGFRPIIRQDAQLPAVINQVANRREDPGSEIDEAMETDTLFLTAQQDMQKQNFEPMFIPSPPDSTNATIIVRKVVPSPPMSQSKPVQPITEAKRTPIAATLTAAKPALPKFTVKRREPTLEDLFQDDPFEQEDEQGNDDPIAETIKQEKLKSETKETAIEAKQEPKLKLKQNHAHVSSEDDLDDDGGDREEDDESMQFADSMFFNDDQDDDENDEFEDDMEDEHEAQAAERIDTYYLPPDNRKIPHASVPSGAVPVVTYDGKSVVDSSLVLPPKLETRDGNRLQAKTTNQGLSRTEELVRSTPQFKPFRGEMPPSIDEFLSTERSLQLGGSPISEHSNPILQHSIGSDNSPPFIESASPSSLPFISPRPISTKLHIVKSTA